MRNAEIAQVGTPRQLYEEPDNVFVATFMGDANHVRGTLADKNGERGRVQLGGVSMLLPHRGLPEGEVDIIVRPESIILNEADAEGVVPATVATATYMGSHAEYNLDTPVGRIFAVDQTGATRVRSPAEKIGLRFAEHRGVLLVRP